MEKTGFSAWSFAIDLFTAFDGEFVRYDVSDLTDEISSGYREDYLNFERDMQAAITHESTKQRQLSR